MDNAQKAIMIGVGLFITIIIIAAVMLITGMGQELMNSGTKKLSQVSSTLQDQMTREYDNVQVTGAQVLSAIQKYYSDPELVVAVNNVKGGGNSDVVWVTPNMADSLTRFDINGNNRVPTTKGIKENTSQPAYGSFTNAAGAAKDRVVTTGQYQAYLIDLNGSVLGVYFKRK